MKKIRLAIADDNAQFRKATARLLETEDDMEVVLHASNGMELLNLISSTALDIVLMDIRMPEMDGTEAAARIRELFPDLKIIVFSQYDQEENIIKMYTGGVKTFIGKEDPGELIRAIRIVYEGGVYLTNQSAEIIQWYLLNKKHPAKPNCPPVSNYEKILINYIVKGLSSRQIGERLNKSPRTIDDYREKIYHKLGVSNKEQLIALAVKLNLYEDGNYTL